VEEGLGQTDRGTAYLAVATAGRQERLPLTWHAVGKTPPPSFEEDERTLPDRATVKISSSRHRGARNGGGCSSSGELDLTADSRLAEKRPRAGVGLFADNTGFCGSRTPRVDAFFVAFGACQRITLGSRGPTCFRKAQWGGILPTARSRVPHGAPSTGKEETGSHRRGAIFSGFDRPFGPGASESQPPRPTRPGGRFLAGRTYGPLPSPARNGRGLGGANRLPAGRTPLGAREGGYFKGSENRRARFPGGPLKKPS